MVYRPVVIDSMYMGNILCLIVFVGFNGYIHYRVRSGRDVTLKWMLVFSTLDVVLITVAMVVGGGFSEVFFYLLYYPTLAWFAVFFSSFGLSFGWVTLVAVIYIIVSLTVGEGLDL